MSWALYAVAAYLTLGGAFVVLMVGREREPITPGGALLGLVLLVPCIVLIVLAGLRIGGLG